MPMTTPTVLGPAGSGAHAAFVKDAQERFNFYREQRMNVVRDTLDFYDLYLTKKREFRAKGEEWRANLGLPDAFANVEAKVANLLSVMLSADPVVQPEGVTDSDMESARSVERLIDYAYRKNMFPKWLTKVLRARSIAGTCFFKLTWTELSNTFTFSNDPKAVAAFMAKVQAAEQMPGSVAAPDWQTETEAFEVWRKMLNDARNAKIPAPPLDGPQTLIRYRGPKLHVLPLTSIYLDPLIDEIGEQNFLLHRVVKPESWLLEKVKAGAYDADAVDYAMTGWDGRVKEDEEAMLAAKMNITSDSSASADPYYRRAVELWELWQPGTSYPYSLILNQRACINKRPTEMPFIHGEPSIGATRGVVVPGHFYGISDLQPPADLFWEKRKLRNLRVDAVTMNVLPAYLKLKEVGLPEMMHKIRPGALIPASRPDAISPLLRNPLPPEAYREPADMDVDIADSMGVYASTKGAPAMIGRVTGTEFQGRENRAQIRFKLDSLFLEEDLSPINRQIVAMFAQLGDDPLIVKVGGDPNPVLTFDRATLMESMDTQWRFRGPNKAINRDMQVQHLLMWVKTFGQNLTPPEQRYAARLVLDLLDVRGAGKLVTPEATAKSQSTYDAQSEATDHQQQAQIDQAKQARAGVQPPAPPDPAVIKANADLQKEVMHNATVLAAARIAASKDTDASMAEDTEEALALAKDQAHEAGQAALDRTHEAGMAAMQGQQQAAAAAAAGPQPPAHGVKVGA